MQMTDEPTNVVVFRESTAAKYVEQAIAMFANDPPDNDYQRGYLEALLTIQREAFNPRARLPSPPKAEG